MVHNLGAFVRGEAPQTGPVKRWDGAAKTCAGWDELRRDPELWHRNGNCLVYLYGKGQSKRGPSFKLPLDQLLAKRCYPLLRRFLDSEYTCPQTPREFERWGRISSKQTIELYIPPPPAADKTQAYNYHLATRNFFAWIFRRSMVGSDLGGALVTLMHSLHEFRSSIKDNVQDLMDYLDEEGYLDLANHADHAVAMLHLAETFQLSDLYIRAFAHSVGMCDELFSLSAYQEISPTTKTLIRQARADLDSRVYAATDMLKNILDEELSETHMGMPGGTRAHLERFRSFLLSHYANRLGYYPPRSFGPSLFASMRADFEALYSLLVDESYTSEDVTPSVAVGGICTLQLVQDFDSRHQFTPLDHPLPLLPNFTQEPTSRRLTMLRRGPRFGDKLRDDQRVQAYASLMKASNWHEEVLNNDLVAAYRQFEQQTVMSQNKADKQERVSVMDARKIRWILVYALYQVLRSVTEVPPEVFDADQARYFVGISSESLPPWEESVPIDSLLWRQTDEVLHSAMSSPAPSVRWADPDQLTSPGKIELKPDIDYFALTHPEPSLNDGGCPALSSSPSIKVPTRTSSLTHTLSRNNTFRRSMRLFKSPSVPLLEASSSAPIYHEIMVHGYGNGTNTVKLKKSKQTLLEDSAGSSTPASDSDVEVPSPTSECSSDKTVEDEPIETPSPTISMGEFTSDAAPKPLRLRRRQEVVSMIINPTRKSSTKSTRRPLSMLFHSSSVRSANSHKNDNINKLDDSYSQAYEQLVEEQRRSFFDSPELESNARAFFPDFSRHKQPPQQPQPHILEAEDEWAAMQVFMDRGDSALELLNSYGDKDVKPAWEQYADLGGLTEM